MGRDKMPVKAFLEEVERRLAGWSVQELQAVIRGLATRVMSEGRRAFLERLRPDDDAGPAVRAVLAQDALLADIDDLALGLREAIRRADDRYDRQGVSHDHQDSLGPYEWFIAPLAELFDRAACAFEDGDLALTRAAHHRLFEVLAIEDDYGRGIHPVDLPGGELDAARARYLRAVYETEPAEARPATLLQEMTRLDQPLGHPHVRLLDLIDVVGRPLPGQEVFLRDWIDLLRRQSGPGACRWLREGVRLADGTAGLEALARREGKQHPRAWLDWLTALRDQGESGAALRGADEALRKLPRTLTLRAAVADQLCAVAGQLGNPQAFRRGRWEAFAAQPILRRLLDLLEGVPQARRRQRLRQAARHLEEVMSRPEGRADPIRCADGEDDGRHFAWLSSAVLAYAYLLNGDWEGARRLAARHSVLGWSSPDNAQGVVVPAFLVLAWPDQAVLPPILGELWQQTRAASASSDFSADRADDARRLEVAFREGARQHPLDGGLEETVLAWALDVSARRVLAIVDNKHRKSYRKAAVLAAACAEVLRGLGRDAEARALLSWLRQRFARQRAFLDELETAVKPLARRS